MYNIIFVLWGLSSIGVFITQYTLIENYRQMKIIEKINIIICSILTMLIIVYLLN